MVEPQQPQETEQVRGKKYTHSLDVIFASLGGLVMGSTIGAATGACASTILPSAIRGSKRLCKLMGADNATLTTKLKEDFTKVRDRESALLDYIAVHTLKVMYVLSATTASFVALSLLAKPETRPYGITWLATNALSGIYEVGRSIYRRGYAKAKTETAPRPTECL
ncbi:hypothetical protein HYS50_00695 [Candidatus Woesearchaeota archaeon]|nr:hypothetical protein [Candidatus Woesearchaeota archaeon]